MRAVLKFGGSSVATLEKIQAVADFIIKLKRKYSEIAVVASAMGKTTDALIKMAEGISENPNQRELDSLLSTGEQQTISLLSMALNSKGQKAVSFTGYQADVKTTGVHTKSRIQSIGTEKIESCLQDGNIVIIAGFQGINEKGDITTLGRGGSDTSAVALAVSLNCECRIYTDVEGIYTVDPRFYPEAEFLKQISYEDMMEMSHLGAGVMETRAVELGKKFNIPIFVGRSLCETGGTYIMERCVNLEEKLVTGISIIDEIITTTISNISYSALKTAAVFTAVNSCGLNINMVMQNITKDNMAEISFSCKSSEKYLLNQAVNKIKKLFPEAVIDHKEKFGMISVIGVGMINNSDVTGRFFSALSSAGVSFYQTTTSEISISCAIDRNLMEKAVRAAAKEFHL